MVQKDGVYGERFVGGLGSDVSKANQRQQDKLAR